MYVLTHIFTVVATLYKKCIHEYFFLCICICIKVTNFMFYLCIYICLKLYIYMYVHMQLHYHMHIFMHSYVLIPQCSIPVAWQLNVAGFVSFSNKLATLNTSAVTI